MDSLSARVPQGQEFILSNGRVLKNLYELANALQSIDSDTFSHHVNSQKNDFANWIRHVYQDERLADEIERTKEKELIAHHLSQRLVHPSIGELPSVPIESKKTAADKFQKRKKLDKIVPKKSFAQKASKKEGNKYAAKALVEESIPFEVSDKVYVNQQKELLKRLDEVLSKEKEIGIREQKIQEVEERIVTQLEDLKT